MKSRPTIDRVAIENGMSPSQLRRDFLAVYGLVPHVVFRRLRLYEAARLLANTDWTIDRIYPESGFASKVDLHRSFKDEYNLTPHQWRKNISFPTEAEGTALAFSVATTGPVSPKRKSSTPTRKKQ
nr:AraC family transcriptional regulator [Ruficoccus amylovorans]